MGNLLLHEVLVLDCLRWKLKIIILLKQLFIYQKFYPSLKYDVIQTRKRTMSVQRGFILKRAKQLNFINANDLREKNKQFFS